MKPFSEDNISTRQFTKVLGINRNAKYVDKAFTNRDKFDQYIKLKGEIKVGERVECRGGWGTLMSRDVDGSCKIKLEPWGTITKYDKESKARLARLVPKLDVYDRQERIDAISEEDKELIDVFFVGTLLYHLTREIYENEDIHCIQNKSRKSKQCIDTRHLMRKT